MSDTPVVHISLARVQSKLKVGKGQRNDFAGFDFRNASDILSAVKPLLVEHNLLLEINQAVDFIGDRYYIRTDVTVHSTKDRSHVTVSAFAREEDNLKGQISAQISGGASTYSKKYALQNLLALDDSESDPDSQSQNPAHTYQPNDISPTALQNFVKRVRDVVDSYHGDFDAIEVWACGEFGLNKYSEFTEKNKLTQCGKLIKETLIKDSGEVPAEGK